MLYNLFVFAVVFLQFEIIINVRVSSIYLIWIPMLLVYSHYKYFNFFTAGTVFLSKNMTFEDDPFTESGETVKYFLQLNVL